MMTGHELPPLSIRGGHLRFGTRTFVMGIVNITPDSFSGDGLLATTPDVARAAVAQARQMVAEGADIVDVGGESTRPGYVAVDAAEEVRRVVEAIAAIREALPDTPISIDTAKVDVAHACLEAGADMINDVTAVTRETALAAVAAAAGVPYIVMHSRDTPEYDDVVTEVVSDLGRALERAEAAGCATASLIVDPGIGFGKTAEQNLILLRHLHELTVLGHPILLGTSRKSAIGRVLDQPPEQRLEGTLATTALGIAAGADIVRVHDVAPNARAARMTDAIVRGGWHDAQTQPMSAVDQGP